MPTSKSRKILLVCIVFLILGLSKGIYSSAVHFLTPSPSSKITPSSIPTPTPKVEIYSSSDTGVAFGHPSNWTVSYNDSEAVIEATFTSCDQTALIFKEVNDQKISAAKYLGVTANTLTKTTIENHDAYTYIDPQKSTRVIILDPKKSKIFDLAFTPTCNKTLDQAINDQFYPLLSSLRFVSQ